MKSRWPRANFTENNAATAPYAARSFERDLWQKDQPLKVILIGTDFEVRVWKGCLKFRWEPPQPIPTSPMKLANQKRRARWERLLVAIQFQFVVPCHRVVGKSGALTGYHWGLTRKRAMLGWEAGQIAQ